MPAVNGVGEPCAGEPHARFDGRELETEPRPDHGHWDEAQPTGKPAAMKAPGPTVRRSPPRQFPTRLWCLACHGAPVPRLGGYPPGGDGGQRPGRPHRNNACVRPGVGRRRWSASP